ncbi:MAG TPA: hypothetical protein QGF58_06860 [Myxococcota bacterium]|nr:hypothetical protein [Myxococcota bacterium]
MSPLLFSIALAGTDMSRLSPEQVYVMTCQTEVEALGEDWQRVIDSWLACDAEAQRRELDSARPLIRGRIAMAETLRDFGHLQEEDSLEFAKVLLAVAAQRRDVQMPFDDVRAAWLSVLQDPESRVNHEDVLSVTIRILPSPDLTEEAVAALEEQLQRHIGDMGFKVPDSDVAESADSSILIFLEPHFRVAQEGNLARTRLHATEVELKSQPVRYKARDTKGPPLRATERADYSDPEEALRVATDNAARSFAEQLMVQVVREVYTDYELPPARQP